MAWLTPAQCRVGLGCMRLSTVSDRNEDEAAAVFTSALDAGITLFDTAHSYGLDDSDLGHNEKWLGTVLARHPRGADAVVVTKGGMRRPAGRWVPDGRATTLRAQCEASRAHLKRPIDLYLLHAPDGRTEIETSCRALAALQNDGLVRAVGLSNVSLAQLRRAREVMPVAAVELGLSLLDDSALRSGVVTEALDNDITVLCHSPLGGPKRIGQLLRTEWLVQAAQTQGCTPYEWALAALLALDSRIAVLPGCRRPETVASSVRALHVKLPHEALGVLRATLRPTRPVPSPGSPTEGWLEAPGAQGRVLMLMGLQGSGKTTLATRAVAAGATRLNRDELGGTLKSVHQRLGQMLANGRRFVVLDNTYVSRAQRHEVLALAASHGVPTVGVWHDIEGPQAHINIVLRQLAAHQRLLTPEEMARSKTPDGLPPMGFYRTLKQVETPEANEGFSVLERVPFVRRAWPEGESATFFGLETPPSDVGGLKFVIGWLGGKPEPSELADVRILTCPHPEGPPICWCRPPHPGLLLLAAHRFRLNLSRCMLVSSNEALIRMAEAVGVAVQRR
jgi:aryl-alcohol dehydrogenase-like predicted oxidoreductase